MKTAEKKQALILRSQGYSIKDIAKKLGVAKSSVSLWVRTVELSAEQKEFLRTKGLLREEIERRRITRRATEKAKRDIFIASAVGEVRQINRYDLWLIGVMLYWGEGGKTRKSVRFSNSDPTLIKMIMMFFRTICNVPEEKFRGYIHIHPHLDHKKAESYWSAISEIPFSQFYKTYRIPSKNSRGKKDSLQYGTFDVYVLDTFLFYKIIGWVRGIAAQLSIEITDSFGADERI